MMRCGSLLLAVVIGLAVSTTAQAEWSWPSLNPWSSSTPKTSKSSSWSILPSSTSKPTAKGGQTSVMGKMQQGVNSMTQGTKNLYNKSARALTPWKNTSNNQRSVTGYGTRTSGSTNKKPAPAKSWLPNLSPWPEEEKKPSDITDFLRQSRPGA